jgi:hypothetical protein
MIIIAFILLVIAIFYSYYYLDFLYSEFDGIIDSIKKKFLFAPCPLLLPSLAREELPLFYATFTPR